VSYSNRGIAYANQTLACKSKVLRQWVEDEQGFLECNIWAEDQEGEKLTLGNATVVLPRKQ